MVIPGELDKRITFQYQTFTPDGSGGNLTSWANYRTVWAKAWAVSSTEKDQSMQVQQIRIQKFKIRFRRGINSSMRILWGSRYFNIIGLDPDATLESIFITCKEVT
jgi:SPP1 family predicted phage head-tail adaptor